MRSLDPQLWKARVFSRFHRAPAHRTGRAARRMVNDIAAVDGMACVVEWCSQNGIDVAFVRHAGGNYVPGKATVSCTLSAEKQFFVLLHECGHHLVNERDAEHRFRRGYAERDPRFLKTNVHRIDIVHEELEAWHEGLELAHRLGLPVDIDRFNKVRAGYVLSYLKWALRRPGYEGGLSDGEHQGPTAGAARRRADLRPGGHVRGRHHSHGKDGPRHASCPEAVGARRGPQAASQVPKGLAARRGVGCRPGDAGHDCGERQARHGQEGAQPGRAQCPKEARLRRAVGGSDRSHGPAVRQRRQGDRGRDGAQEGASQEDPQNVMTTVQHVVKATASGGVRCTEHGATSKGDSGDHRSRQ